MSVHLLSHLSIQGGWREDAVPFEPQKGKDMIMEKPSPIYIARFELHCSKEELECWKRAASEHGISLAQYIRVGLNRGPALTRKTQVDPDLIRQIAGIGNNLNQIAFWCNAHKSQQEIESVEIGIANIRVALHCLLDNERIS